MSNLEKKAAELAINFAFKNRAKLLASVRDALRHLRDGKFAIALVGIGGTGKTTAQKLLTGSAERAAKTKNYVPTVRTSETAPSGRPFVSILDSPGQKAFREAAWEELTEKLASAANVVILNIVSYGHNSPGPLRFSDMRRFWPNLNKEEVIAEYFRHERQREYDFLADLSRLIQETRGRTHLLTVINKQDLWWNKRFRVRSHYTMGTYGTRLQKLNRAYRRKHLTQSLKSVCLSNINLATADGVVLASTCSGYDAVEQELALSELVGELKQLVD